MDIQIASLIGVNCITLEDGQRIYDMVYPALLRSEVVTLDFADVRIVASPFLNASVGQLLRDFTSDQLNSQVKFLNTSVLTRSTLRQVIENAKAYYGDLAIRGAVDEAIRARAEESNAD